MVIAALGLFAPTMAVAEMDAVAPQGLRMNQIQLIGTHNSYKQPILPAELAAIRAVDERSAKGLDYAHPPLAEQLDAGARSLEIDLLIDPETGRYAKPLGRLAAGGQEQPGEFDELRKPGLKVLHMQDLDYRSHCHRFTQCLTAVDAWSRAHAGHAPLIITLNLKSGASSAPGGVVAPDWTQADFEAIDREIASVLGPERLITPDLVRGKAATLREAVTQQGWPVLSTARGRIMFVLDASDAQREAYRRGRASLDGLTLFVMVPANEPGAAVFIINDAIGDGAQIKALVREGFIIRTRADADTREARTNDVGRREAAFASGAQVITTDYILPRPDFSPYHVAFPEGGAVRANPVSAAAK